MQLSHGTKDIVTELGQRVKIVADRMISVGDALNERASYDDVARSITQVQTVFESLSDRLTGLIARVDMIERSLVESQSNHPAIGGVNLKIEDLSTRMCQIDRMMQDVEQCWTNSRDGIKWVKDQLYETQANLEIKSRDCKSYTDRQNTHNMAVSTTLNSKLEQMLEVLGNTAQRINSLESKHSNQASSSGLNDHTGGRRAASRNPDKRPPPPGPPDDDPPPPPPPDRQSPGGGGKKSAAGGNPGDPGKPRCRYVGDGYNHLMAEFHCKGCRSDICEYCFSFKENLCEECSRNGPRCGVCRESSFLTKGMSVSFVRPSTAPDILLGRMTTGDLDLSRVPVVLRALGARLGEEGIPKVTVSGIDRPEAHLRRTRRGRSHRLCGHPLTDSVTLQLGINPMRLTFRVLRRLRNPCPWINVKPDIIQDLIPTVQGRRILRALSRRPCVAPILLTRNVGCVIGNFPTPAKLGNVKRACEICIPKATRLCPVCALSIGSSQVPQHLFGTGGGGYSSHHDPNCTAATKCIAIDLPPEPDAAGLRVWIANMKEAVSNAYSYDGLYVINWLTEVEKAKTFDELDGECKYHILEARFNAAIRKCIKTVAIIDKINRLTEAAQRSNNRIKSRQILWLLYDHLRTANIGEQSFRIIELSNLRCSVSSFYTEEERLERFIAKWDHILAGLDEPLTEQVKRSLFSEKVRHLNCLAHDIREWDRNISNPDVCSYEWLRARCKNEIDRWRVRKNQVNMHKDFYERSQSRDRAQKPGAPGPPVRRRSPFGESHRPNRPPSDPRKRTGNTPSPHRRDRYSPRNREPDKRRTPSPRSEPPRRPRSTSPGAPAIDACRDFTRGYCSRGQECKFAHTRTGSSDAKRKERPPLIPGYCAQWISYGKCMRDKCDYKHAKPPEHLLKEAKQHTAAPATESADAQPESAEPTTTADDRTYSPAPDLSAGF